MCDRHQSNGSDFGNILCKRPPTVCGTCATPYFNIPEPLNERRVEEDEAEHIANSANADLARHSVTWDSKFYVDADQLR